MEAPQHEVETPKKNSRLRFSLGTMIVGALILTLVISNLFTSWHLQKAREEERVQRAKIAALWKKQRQFDTSIGDHVHVLALDTNQEMTWKWRIYIPDGKRFWLRTVVGKTDDRSFPRDNLFRKIGPGEMVLTCSVARNAAGEWEQSVRQSWASISGTDFIKIPEASMEWYGKPGSSSTAGSITPSFKQQSFSGNREIELLRFRKWVHSNPNKTIDPSETTDGVLLWLDPIEE